MQRKLTCRANSRTNEMPSPATEVLSSHECQQEVTKLKDRRRISMAEGDRIIVQYAGKAEAIKSATLNASQSSLLLAAS